MPSKLRKRYEALVRASLFGGFSDPSYLSTDPDPARTDPYRRPPPPLLRGRNFATCTAPRGPPAEAAPLGPWAPFADPPRGWARPPVGRPRRGGRAPVSTRPFRVATGPLGPPPPVPHIPENDTAACRAHNQRLRARLRAKVRGLRLRYRTKDTRKILQFNTSKTDFMGRHLKTFLTTKKKIADNTALAIPAGMVDEYNALKRLCRENAIASKKKYLGRDFMLIGLPKRTFDENITGVSAIYEPFQCKESKKKSKKSKTTLKLITNKQWKYPLSRIATFSSFPNTFEDQKLLALLQNKKVVKPNQLFSNEKPWKPTSGPKSSVIKSLLA